MVLEPCVMFIALFPNDIFHIWYFQVFVQSLVGNVPGCIPRVLYSRARYAFLWFCTAAVYSLMIVLIFCQSANVCECDFYKLMIIVRLLVTS